MIITQLNAPYSHWLDLFLTSLRRTNPGVNTRVEVVNFHPALAAYFATKYPDTEFVPVALEDPSRNLMAHRKVDAALRAVEERPGEPWYLVCDVDLLFRASLAPLIEAFAGRDAGVVFRDGLWEGQYYEHLRVACGFVLFRDRRLIERWKAEMARPTCLGYGSDSWFYDQITLVSATRALALDYLSIDPRLYINRDFDPEARVWSANLDPKEVMYLRFLEELQRLP